MANNKHIITFVYLWNRDIITSKSKFTHYCGLSGKSYVCSVWHN